MDRKKITIKAIKKHKSNEYSIVDEEGNWYNNLESTFGFKKGDKVVIEEANGKFCLFSDEESKKIESSGSLEEEVWAEVVNIHKNAFDAAKQILGRTPQNHDMHFVNSIIVNITKGLYFKKQENRNI